MEWFSRLAPVWQALAGATVNWLLTALGAGVVLVFRTVNRTLLDGMLGFAAGVMIAASYWSLLAPAIQMAQGTGVPAWIPAAVGFLVGGVFLWILDRILPHLHPGLSAEEIEGIPTRWRRSVLLIMAVTLHNIPEGLAVGVAFGAVAAGIPAATLAGAVALSIGIGIQNIPEGTAVAAPLRREGLSPWRSFWYGQLSGVVEPVAAVVGAVLVVAIRAMLPYALAFAAGAMIYVVVEELIPESQANRHTHVATFGVMVGFVVMMILDVAMG